MTAVARFRQGVRALFAFATPVDIELAAQYLNERQLQHFQAMSRSEQLHSLNVLRTLLAQGNDVPHDLSVAALMHDVGKSRYHLWVWQKTIAVLVKKFLPVLSQRLSRDTGTLYFWNAPFVVRQHHPRWSGDILRQCNSTETAIWLAEHHQEQASDWRDYPHYELLVRLQAADNAN